MHRKADEILTFLEIDHLRDRPMTAMSSGESRLLIGRALVHDPKTLMLDEPSNSLDLHALHAFRSILRKIAQSGTGIILVTHNLHDIIPEITRVVLMKDGRFCADGPKERMLTDTRIGDLFRDRTHQGGRRVFLCNRFLTPSGIRSRYPVRGSLPGQMQSGLEDPCFYRCYRFMNLP